MYKGGIWWLGFFSSSCGPTYIHLLRCLNHSSGCILSPRSLVISHHAFSGCRSLKLFCCSDASFIYRASLCRNHSLPGSLQVCSLPTHISPLLSGPTKLLRLKCDVMYLQQVFFSCAICSHGICCCATSVE
jgi:hypothetical protein